jgi:hypothetical protein
VSCSPPDNTIHIEINPPTEMATSSTTRQPPILSNGRPIRVAAGPSFFDTESSAAIASKSSAKVISSYNGLKSPWWVI